MFGISGEDEREVVKASNKLYDMLKNFDINIFRPVPAPVSKIKNKHRWRIIAKCRLNNSTIDWVNNALQRYYELKYKNVTVIVDVNPGSLM